MQFTEAEVRFLLSEHPIETATGCGPRRLPPAADLRELGCPEPIFARVLDSRARRLGRRFSEFRAAHATPSTSGLTLEDRITATKLF